MLLKVHDFSAALNEIGDRHVSEALIREVYQRQNPAKLGEAGKNIRRF